MRLSTDLDDLGHGIFLPAAGGLRRFTVWYAPRFVTRRAAARIHAGEPSPSRATWLLHLRRALSRALPGLFDAEPGDCIVRVRADALHLDVGERFARDVALQLPLIARDLDLTVFDGGARELMQPVRASDARTLEDALTELEPDACVVVEGGLDDRLYVQAFVEGPRGARRLALEAVSSSFLPPTLRLSSEAHEALRYLGWCPAGESCPNHHATRPHATAGGRRAAAHLLSRTLMDAYGFAAGSVLSLRLLSLSRDG
ncbi:MAG TPA: hypothetical protein RMH99_21415 [Sandaracinaceae bacterium LLY-WYZ-13_1]|nr:hypothetical protein [Sandaracinaceae bacterium LLY-WYZ-13_1]